MSVFNKYGPCRGITLYSFGKYRAELWYVPPYYELPEHKHPTQNGEIMYLFGKTMFYRRKFEGPLEFVEMNWKKFLRCFTVKHYHYHWFEISKWPLVFINFQTFIDGSKPVSAAVDFEKY